MDNILVSVIVPIYNGDKYINRCCEQLSLQTLADLEVILIDDGSTDNSFEICKKMQKEYSNCRCFHQENQGVSVARNYGISVAKGEYIGFVDVDDEYEIDMYETLYNLAQTYNTPIVGMDDRWEHNEKCILIEEKQDAIEEFMKKNISMSVWNKLFRKDIISGIEFPRGIRIQEDASFVFDALMRSGRYLTSSEMKYHYIRRDGSSSRLVVFHEKNFDSLIVCERMCNISRKQFPMLEESIHSREVSTYLWLVQMYYKGGMPKQHSNRIKEIRKRLCSLKLREANHLFFHKDIYRFMILKYCLPIFIVFSRTIDKR